MLCLHCFEWAFSSCGEQGLLSGYVARASHGGGGGGGFSCGAGALDTQALVVVMHKLSCPEACGIFLDPGSNPCPLLWQADS